ncbi:amidohydrolase family protein [Sinorhizobium medicae]|uniref:Putative Allantoinase n=1 Tax=Sinorhizobium medicae TaxID=110321 RepID=A0A508XC31_9HYPH|nr:amidohydrolase family protein [Sinorhizobium medicae]VTZ65857.1 putative Allantoinase [Sinorhizobium medicae]
MNADLYIRNGWIVTRAEMFAGGVLVLGGKIAGLVRGNPDYDLNTIDVHGQIVLPGLVDPHVHFSEPGRGHWEGFATGSRAAAVGGVTTVVEMPLNASPPTVDVDAFEMKRMAARSSLVDYGLWGGLVTDNRTSLAGLHAVGVLGFKAFMCTGSADFPRAHEVVLEDGMKQIAGFGSVLAVHAEDEHMTRSLTADMRNAGRKDTGAWGQARPIAAELAAIQTVLKLAEKTGARLHIVHVSCASGIDLISEAKQRGIAATAETCPHYLYFSQDDLDRSGLGWIEIARMTATNPARLVGLGGRKGEIAPGFDADFAIVDPSASTALTCEDLHYKNRHSAYVGERLEGWVTRTVLRGLMIQQDGRIMSDEPGGMFLAGGGQKQVEITVQAGG